MKTLLALSLLLVLGLVARPHRHAGLSRFSRYFLGGGGEFLMLGWVLGNLGVLGPGILDALQPLITLGLGWIGLLIGLQFELRLLRRVPASFHSTALLQGLLVMALVTLGFWPLLRALFGGGLAVQATALVLGAAAATSSQEILALVLRERRGHAHAPIHLYRYSAAVDSILPVITLMLLAGLGRGRTLFMGESWGWLQALRWTLLGTLLGFFLGLLFVLLLHRVRQRPHQLLLFVGYLLFSGGLSTALGFPPLFVNFAAGVLAVNLAGHQHRVWEFAAASERPFYTMFLLLVGAAWHPGSPWVWLLAPLFFILRVSAKAGSLWLAGRLSFGRSLLDLRSGLALSGQGATAVALAASVQMIERSTLAESALTVILSAVLLSALFAPGLTRLGLQRGVRP